MPGVPQVVMDSAAAVLLLGAVIASAQWLLRHIYGEVADIDDVDFRENDSCHQPR